MTCDTCHKDDCGGKCAMDKAFKPEPTKLLYNSTGFTPPSVREDLTTIEYLALNLPDVNYILTSIVNYMFTNELTTKDREKDKILNSYLQSLNFNGQRNIDTLKEVAKGYRKYGYYGLLNTGKGLVGVHPKNILACVVDNDKYPVIRQTLTYLIKRDGLQNKGRFNGLWEGTNFDETELLEIIKDPEKYKEDIMVVSDDEFVCVRLDTSQVFGMSPLLYDRKRIELVLNILERMNYDISRNGIGTIALQAKDTLEEQIEESIESGSSFSGGELLDLSRSAKQDRQKQIIEDMEKFADELSKTEFNDAIVYSGKFQNLEQLERDTKATDFLDYLSMYVSPIICQMFGVPARLFDIGKTVSNIGTHSIIDNAMKNNIIPDREHFIGQCGNVLRKATGLEETLEFASYEFTNSYNYNNDLYILDAYERLLAIDADKAKVYLDKNLIV